VGVEGENGFYLILERLNYLIQNGQDSRQGDPALAVSDIQEWPAAAGSSNEEARGLEGPKMSWLIAMLR